MEMATPAGPARVELDLPDDPAFLLVVTHGAGGGVEAPDLLAVRAVALGLGGAVARVLQPYRVGRPAPARPGRRAGRGVAGGRRGAARAGRGRPAGPVRAPRSAPGSSAAPPSTRRPVGWSRWRSRCTRPGPRTGPEPPSCTRRAWRSWSSTATATRSASLTRRRRPTCTSWPVRATSWTGTLPWSARSWPGGCADGYDPGT